MSRVPHIFLFAIAGVFAIFMALYGEKELDLGFTSGTLCSSSTCTGNGSVYRVSFLLFLYYLLHSLIVASGKLDFHWMWFCVKFCVFSGCVTLTFLVGDSNKSNAFFYGYAIYFARYVSGLYLLMQITILITWAYRINDELRADADAADEADPDQDEDERGGGANWSLCGMVAGSIVLYIASFVLCGLFFVWYGDVDSSECAEHRTLIALTLCIVLINGIASIAVGNGTFFVSAVVSFYCVYLCFAALQADDDETCNIYAGKKDTASTWIGYVFTFMAIFYAAYRADDLGLLIETGSAESEETVIDMGMPLEVEEAESQRAAADREAAEKREAERDRDASMLSNKAANDEDVDEEKEPLIPRPEPIANPGRERFSNTCFHAVMTMASCYIAMLLTSWGTGSTLSTTGETSMYVNIVCQYITALFFWWTLCAPAIWPSRFGDADDDE